MNFENIRRIYIEYGMPIMLIGLVIYAMGWIVNYIIQTVWNVSYPVIVFLIPLGMLLIVIGAFSIVVVVRHI